jgi:hypothetical protein
MRQAGKYAKNALMPIYWIACQSHCECNALESSVSWIYLLHMARLTLCVFLENAQ